MATNTLINLKDPNISELSIQIRSSDPSLTAGVARIWFNTTTEQLKYYNGTTTQIIPNTRQNDGTFQKLYQNNTKKLTGNTLVFDANCFNYSALVNINQARGTGSGFTIDLNSMQEGILYTINLFLIRPGNCIISDVLQTIYRETNQKTKNSCLIYLTKIDGNLNIKVEKELVNLKGFTTSFSWGYNIQGQLGDNTVVDKSSPVQVANQSDFVAISAGGNHSLILKTNGTAWTWGSNTQGQLGDNTVVDKSVPTLVVGQSDFVAISAGVNHSLALKTNGTAWTWGYNNFGQLGDNTIANKSSPIQIFGQSDFVAISAGGSHSLSLKSNGIAWTWGSNSQGQLGDNTAVAKSSPVQVVGQSDFVAIAAGSAHSLALKGDGRVFSWGNNAQGQLGDNTAINKSSPVQVINQSDFVAIATGANHCLALKADGTVWAWGNNAQGQLGDNTIVNKSVPTLVVGQSNFVAIAAATGANTSLALKADGRVFSWGSNTNGQLGDNTAVNKSSPVQVVGQSDFVAIAAAANHSIGLKKI